jgi:hypothetical protein
LRLPLQYNILSGGTVRRRPFSPRKSLFASSKTREIAPARLATIRCRPEPQLQSRPGRNVVVLGRPRPQFGPVTARAARVPDLSPAPDTSAETRPAFLASDRVPSQQPPNTLRSGAHMRQAHLTLAALWTRPGQSHICNRVSGPVDLALPHVRRSRAIVVHRRCIRRQSEVEGGPDPPSTPPRSGLHAPQ